MKRLAALLHHLRATAWDLDVAGYAAALVALIALSGVLGPTLDRHAAESHQAVARSSK